MGNNMINEFYANKFCTNYKNIENYDLAMADDTQTWDCHHKREISENKSVKQLIDERLYYDRPADELVFLTKSEHMKLHHIGKVFSDETCKKMSDALIGENNPWFGKHHSEETRKKMSEAHKGTKSHMYGQHLSEETKIKISESQKGKVLTEETKQKMSEAKRGTHWKLIDGKRIYYKEAV